MRKNIETVMRAFVLGQYANEKTIHTDGVTLYSYAMPIAKRRIDATGEAIYFVKDKSAAPSRTTNGQIMACKAFLRANGTPFNPFV